MKKPFSKGTSVLVSHAALAAVGIAALIIISSMVWVIYDAVVREEIRKDLTKVSQSLAEEIMKLYTLKDSPAVPGVNKSLLLGEAMLELQQKAGGRQYMIKLVQPTQIAISNLSEGNTSKYATQIIATVSNPRVQVNYTLFNIESKAQGFGFGDSSFVLRYFRLNANGTVEDRIVLNDALVIGGELME